MSATICRPVVPAPVDIRAADIFGFCPTSRSTLFRSN